MSWHETNEYRQRAAWAGITAAEHRHNQAKKERLAAIERALKRPPPEDEKTDAHDV